MNFYGYNHENQEWVTVFDESDYIITYTTTSGEVIRASRPKKKLNEPELQAGDSSALDNFLGGFAGEKK